MMIECPNCQSTYVDNVVFCNECGTYLVEVDRETEATSVEIERETEPESEEIAWLGEAIDKARVTPTFQPGAPPNAIQLLIGFRKREVWFPLDKVIHLGRADPASNLFPEVDLSDDGFSAKAVSRRHARIFKQGDTVLVEDLGSTNGTFLNGKRLEPHTAETLSDGDTLQLGKLQIGIKLV